MNKNLSEHCNTYGNKWAVTVTDTDILQQCKVNGSCNVYSTFLVIPLLHFYPDSKTTCTVYTI